MTYRHPKGRIVSGRAAHAAAGEVIRSAFRVGYGRAGPVSYTHLDVYKRQARCDKYPVPDHLQNLSGRAAI